MRQWWRVAYAADCNFKVDLAAMRHDEALLFGHAWLENDTFQRDGRQVTTAARKSAVRLRLDSWDEGKLKKSQWAADETVTHPEVKNDKGQPKPVGASLYQRFGPLVYDKQQQKTALKANAAIQSNESATLSLAVPDAHAAHIEQALTLMHRYGTLGGRSRNGWGSFSLAPLDNTPALGGESPLRAWKSALALDWPHALGQDSRPLIWQTPPCDNWKAVMKRLAEIKIGLRTQFGFNTGENASRPEDRHWLAYPVTKHSVQPWGNNARLPNTLRFKVRATPDGKLVGVIFHVPHQPPDGFRPDIATLERVWKQVHACLDTPAHQLTRIPE